LQAYLEGTFCITVPPCPDIIWGNGVPARFPSLHHCYLRMRGVSLRLMGCLHDEANMKQTSSKLKVQVLHVNIHYICLMFVSSCKHPITLILTGWSIKSKSGTSMCFTSIEQSDAFGND